MGIHTMDHKRHMVRSHAQGLCCTSTGWEEVGALECWESRVLHGVTVAATET